MYLGATLCFFICIAASLAAQMVGSDNANSKVTYLDPGSITEFKPVSRHRGFLQSDMRIYCYRGETKTIPRLFESIEMLLDINGDDYTQYEGLTPEEVVKHYEEQRSIFSLNLFSSKRTRLQLSPFGQHCIGIETAEAYRVKLQQLRVDFWRVIQLLIGITIFAYAGHLSHNEIFFYITGVLFGICSSFMLLIWLTSKLMPRRPIMYGVLIGGWTIGVYILQLLWENLQVIVITYRSYVFWYIMITGVISFLICYRWGPPKNQRSKNIIKWILQFIALIMIYLCSYFEEATVAIIFITAMMNYFPLRILLKIKAQYLRRFPPKRRLLTNEEYYEEGVRETTKALDNLRTYASSPECKQWKMMSKLKDPLRFAAFVEGASHLRDEEILRFESSHMEKDDSDTTDISDDEDAARDIGVRQQIPSPGLQFENDDDLSEEEDDDAAVTRNYNHHTRYTPNNLLSTISARRSLNHDVKSRSTTPYSNFESRSYRNVNNMTTFENSRSSLSRQTRRSSRSHSYANNEYVNGDSDNY